MNSNQIFYARVGDTLDDRLHVQDAMEDAGYMWIDATGGQIGFDTILKNGDVGTFGEFVEAVVRACRRHNAVLLEVKQCVDPGLGLFS